MSSAERNVNDRNPERRAGTSSENNSETPSGSESKPDSIPLNQIAGPRSSGTGVLRRAPQPRIWILPSATGTVWAAAESEDPALLRDWASSPPLILSQNIEKIPGDEVAAAARQALTQPATNSFHEAIFRLLSRGLVGVVWLLVAVAGLRAPGVFKAIAEVLLLCGVGFLFYSLFRHGSNLLKTQHQLVDAGNAFGKATWKHSPLLDRFAHAMKLRASADASKHGTSPDEELLDAAGYRKLIAEGLTTPQELHALGTAAAKQLGLDKPDVGLKRNNELARDSGVDVETIMFYKDLTSAAKVIHLESIH